MGNDSREEMRRKVQARVEEEKKDLPPEEEAVQDLPGKKKILDAKVVQKFFECNELGDSLLFNRLHRGKFVKNMVSNEWMEFIGPHWEVDHDGSSAKAHMEYVVEKYIEFLKVPLDNEIKELEKDEEENKAKLKTKYGRRKEIQGRIDWLRQNPGKNRVLQSCICNFDPLKIYYSDLDQKPWLLPLNNGVYDLKLNRFFEGGRYDDYITVCAPTIYDADATCPRWEKFLKEILGSEAVVNYLHRILGYSLAGLYIEHIFVVLYGPHGRNGKGTLINVLNKILGKLVGKMNSEMLMTQRFSKGGSGPSPEVMDFRNRCILWSSETERGQSFAHGKVKEFTGGEPLKGRGLLDKYMTEFYPSYVLFLLCNDLPKAPPQDKAFWSRIRVVPFPYSFESIQTESYHRPVNKNLEAELLEEAPGIINWLIRGNQLWQEQGESPPPEVLKAAEKYREHVDELQDWIDANCHVDFKEATKENRESAKLLYGNYRDWWEARNSTKPMNQNEFSDQLQAKGFKKIKSGNIYYQSIRLVITATSED